MKTDQIIIHGNKTQIQNIRDCLIRGDYCPHDMCPNDRKCTDCIDESIQFIPNDLDTGDDDHEQTRHIQPTSKYAKRVPTRHGTGDTMRSVRGLSQRPK